MGEVDGWYPTQIIWKPPGKLPMGAVEASVEAAEPVMKDLEASMEASVEDGSSWKLTRKPWKCGRWWKPPSKLPRSSTHFHGAKLSNRGFHRASTTFHPQRTLSRKLPRKLPTKFPPTQASAASVETSMGTASVEASIEAYVEAVMEGRMKPANNLTFTGASALLPYPTQPNPNSNPNPKI